MNLPLRLEKIAEAVPVSACAADIGCDHAYVSIALIEKGKASHVIACDVRPGPLEAAERNIRAAGMSGKIETRLGDGLAPVRTGEADTVIIAGMGGELMRRILNGRLGDFREFVLSPQSDLAMFRHFLTGQHMDITAETMVEDGGKYYVIMNVKRECICGGAPDAAADTAAAVTAAGSAVGIHAEYEYIYGWRLLEQKSPVFLRFLRKEKNRLEGILSITDKDTVRREYAYLKEAMDRTGEKE